MFLPPPPSSSAGPPQSPAKLATGETGGEGWDSLILFKLLLTETLKLGPLGGLDLLNGGDELLE